MVGTTRGRPPPSRALNSGLGRWAGGTSHSAPGGRSKPAPSSLAKTPPLAPAARSTCGGGRPGPGRGCSGCDPSPRLLFQIRVGGPQSPFLSTQFDGGRGHSRVPTAFRWAGPERLGRFSAGATPHSPGTLFKPLARGTCLSKGHVRPGRQRSPGSRAGARALDPRRGGARGGGGSASHVGADAGCSATPA